jgi:ATP-dependent protease ClpP protease subunit
MINPRLLSNCRTLGALTNRAATLTMLGYAPRDTACHRIVNEGDRTKIYVYDIIGGWDLDADTFVRDVHAITTASIDVHVNSPGGLVWDAVAMGEALQQHPATVDVHVDAVAASAATVIAMAGDDIGIAKPGRMMIHDAMGIAIGNAGDLREAADVFDAVSSDIAGIYADRAGGTVAGWRDAMLANNRAGTWYSSSQAVEAGLADRVTGESNGTENRATQLIRARARVHLEGVTP